MQSRRRFKVRRGPAGIRLFDRSSGLNVLLDEIRVPSSHWALAPRFVSIALTNACDLACGYCYAPKSPAQLDKNSLMVWLDELDRNGCLAVGFGGGEPTLHPDLIEICAYAAQKTNLGVSMTTHGHHFTDKMTRCLSGNIHFVRLSMDGIGKTYQQLRGRSFDAFRANVEIIRRIVHFGINFVVNSRTVNDLDSATDWAAEMGASEFLLLPEQSVAGGGGIDSETALRLQSWVRSYAGRVPLTVSEAGADGLPTCNPVSAEIGLHAYAHVSAAGVLKLSSYDSGGVHIGRHGILRSIMFLRERTPRTSK